MKWNLIPLALMLAACDSSPPPQPRTERPVSPAFETQIRAVEKAHAMEGQVRDAADAQRNQLDEASRP